MNGIEVKVLYFYFQISLFSFNFIIFLFKLIYLFRARSAITFNIIIGVWFRWAGTIANWTRYAFAQDMFIDGWLRWAWAIAFFWAWWWCWSSKNDTYANDNGHNYEKLHFDCTYILFCFPNVENVNILDFIHNFSFLIDSAEQTKNKIYVNIFYFTFESWKVFK